MKRTILAILVLSLTACASQGKKPPVVAQKPGTTMPLHKGPKYPRKMAMANIDATIIMKSDISKDGKNINCKIIKSLRPEFNNSALDYCKNEKYIPPLVNGVPVFKHDHLIFVKYQASN